MFILLCSFRHSHRACVLRRRLLRRVALVHQVRPWGAQERRLPCTHQALVNRQSADSKLPDEATLAVPCWYTPGLLDTRHPLTDGRVARRSACWVSTITYRQNHLMQPAAAQCRANRYYCGDLRCFVS